MIKSLNRLVGNWRKCKKHSWVRKRKFCVRGDKFYALIIKVSRRGALTVFWPFCHLTACVLLHTRTVRENVAVRPAPTCMTCPVTGHNTDRKLSYPEQSQSDFLLLLKKENVKTQTRKRWLMLPIDFTCVSEWPQVVSRLETISVRAGSQWLISLLCMSCLSQHAPHPFTLLPPLKEKK